MDSRFHGNDKLAGMANENEMTTGVELHRETMCHSRQVHGHGARLGETGFLL